MANADNLRPFKKGYDPRRGSKPKGSKHLSTYIREMLEDENLPYKLPPGLKAGAMPVEALIYVLIRQAISGNLKAIDLLAKYGYGTKVDLAVVNRPVPRMTPEQAEQLLRLRANRGKQV